MKNEDFVWRRISSKLDEDAVRLAASDDAPQASFAFNSARRLIGIIAEIGPSHNNLTVSEHR